MAALLDGVNDPRDLKNLTDAELLELSEEIRAFLITQVSKTGGHLASNLGVVELTLALHKVFESPRDKLIWDVGHQSYVHKMLTGRKERFETLRQEGGLSGFPKRHESAHDAFDTGHSSTSLSAALGLARARDLKHEDYHVVAVIGDGAMTGGMAYEALNDIGHDKNLRLIIILNDNEMSISQNVGGMSTYLNKMRTKHSYFRMKDRVNRFLSAIPVIGKGAAELAQALKQSVKSLFFPDTIFDELGLKYMGPYDGHDIPTLELVLEKAKESTRPVLIHLVTQKGKGFSYAEDEPERFHGVGAFDSETGECVSPSRKGSFSEAFSEAMVEFGEKDNAIVAITAAMEAGTGLSAFGEKFPNRIFDVGISEQHAVTYAAGLAAGGMKPVFAIYSSFLQRGYDQVLHDAALQSLHVVFAIDRAGAVGADGETHQGIFDMAYLSHIPNMMILAPSCYGELHEMLRYALFEAKGPVAVRYPRGAEEMALPRCEKPFKPDEVLILEEGEDAVLLAIGSMTATALRARELLLEKGISARVVNMRALKPLTDKTISEAIGGRPLAVTLEDGVLMGGLSSRVAEVLSGTNTRHLAVGYPDEFVEQGTREQIFRRYGMTARQVAERIIECKEQEA